MNQQCLAGVAPRFGAHGGRFRGLLEKLPAGRLGSLLTARAFPRCFVGSDADAVRQFLRGVVRAVPGDG